ncbi:MAG: ferrous iron transport protein B [Nitrospirae bacterium RIFCSPLOW2_12_42_9]|nr:MAG: ferrous iron transport protein B [Nitrospirae bacterium RIFCSPLOW2_12_42_9]
MHSHATETLKKGEKIVIVGNPNVGKSVIFGLLTGRYATVSNYPGTTVTITGGSCNLGGNSFPVIDTPGINTLIPMSEDEVVTRDILLNESIKLVVQVLDSKNLSRGLPITIQLAEMGLPFILVLNMWDEANSRGINIDVKRLASAMGTFIIPTIAVEKKGLKELRDALSEKKYPSILINYGSVIEEGIKEIENILPESNISRRAIALMLLAGDESLKSWLKRLINYPDITRIESVRREVQEKFFEPVGYLINQIRSKRCDKIIADTVVKNRIERNAITIHLGNWAMHPVWGIPVLLVVLILLYEFVGVLGAQTLSELLEDGLFGGYINPYITMWADSFIQDSFFRDLFVGEYGIITMALTYSIAIILPIVGTFFIAFGILEDSGYLPRLAIMVHKIFKSMGLSGKAVLPMVLGLGCDTMATLTARIMETRRERIIVTLLLALGVPCSAQLGVILGMLGGVSFIVTILWAGIITLILFLVGLLASKLIKGDTSDFVFDIPPLRVPVLSNIIIKTLSRINWYLKEAVPLFIVGTLILFTLDKIGVLKTIEVIASPLVVNFLGLPQKATDAFLIGFLRRDYGAAGLYALSEAGLLNPNQILVSLVTITLFVPCVANLLVMIKERGSKTTIAIVAFIFPFAFIVGGVINFVLNIFGIKL